MHKETMMHASDIQKVYDELGYEDGWCFAMTPMAWLKTANTILVGLNPGRPDGDPSGAWEVEEGNAYVREEWGDPIQDQVRRLLTLLDLEEHEMFAAQYVPFRTRSWSQLRHYDKTIKLADDLWRWTLSQTDAKRVITMGDVAAQQIARLLQAQLERESIPAGWGDLVIRRYRSPQGHLIVSLPHPSRYKLLGTGTPEARAQRESAVRRACMIE